MKKYAIARIIICSVLVLVLVAALCFGLYWHKNGWQGTTWGFGGFSIGSYNYPNSGAYTAGGGEIDPEGIQNIEIHWISGSVSVTRSQDSEIWLSENEGLQDEDQLRYLVSGNTLKIQFCAPRFGVYNMTAQKDLEVRLPESLLARLGELKVESVSSAGQLVGISGRSCRIENVSGSWNLTDCTFDHMDLDTVSGGAKLTACSVSTLDMDTVSGSLTAELTDAPKSVDLDTVSADLELTLPAGTGFCAEMDSVSGEVESDAPMTKKGDVYFCGDGAVEIDMDSVSGDVTIHFAA